MATKSAQDDKTELGINAKDAKMLVHDYAYREDMDLSKLAQYLETDWDNALGWLKDLLDAAKMDNGK